MASYGSERGREGITSGYEIERGAKILLSLPPVKGEKKFNPSVF